MESYFDTLYMEEAEIQMQKAIRVSEFYESMEELNMREVELHALNDGGSFDTFCEYYGEAASKDGDKKEGILKRAWESILNLLHKIKEFFTKKKDRKIDKKKKVAVKKSDQDIRKKIIEFFKKYKNAISHPKSNPKAFAAAIAPLVALVGSIAVIKAKNKGKSKSVTRTQSTAAPEKPIPHLTDADVDVVEKAEYDEILINAAELTKEKEQLEVVVSALTNAVAEIMQKDDPYKDVNLQRSAAAEFQRMKNKNKESVALNAEGKRQYALSTDKYRDDILAKIAEAKNPISKLTSEIKTQAVIVDKALDKATPEPAKTTTQTSQETKKKPATSGTNTKKAEASKPKAAAGTTKKKVAPPPTGKPMRPLKRKKRK